MKHKIQVSAMASQSCKIINERYFQLKHSILVFFYLISRRSWQSGINIFAVVFSGRCIKLSSICAGVNLGFTFTSNYNFVAIEEPTPVSTTKLTVVKQNFPGIIL